MTNPHIASLFCSFMADAIDAYAEDWITEFDESLQGRGKQYEITEDDLDALYSLVQKAQNVVGKLA